MTESDKKSIAIVVTCVLLIIAGMAWFLRYDWPSGKQPSLMEFVMFWFRELLILGAVVIVLGALAVQKIFGVGTRRTKE